MSRGKAISVKIPTQRVIAGLESSLAKLEANYATQEASEAKYEKAMEKWRKELQEFAIANIKKAENFRTNYRSYNNRLNIDYDIIVANGKELPTEPEREYELLRQHEYREQKEEMMNAIRILKMTDEETVSTSTYQAVARYL